jgi:hypothetical protein
VVGEHTVGGTDGPSTGEAGCVSVPADLSAGASPVRTVASCSLLRLRRVVNVRMPALVHVGANDVRSRTSPANSGPGPLPGRSWRGVLCFRIAHAKIAIPDDAERHFCTLCQGVAAASRRSLNVFAFRHVSRLGMGEIAAPTSITP